MRYKDFPKHDFRRCLSVLQTIEEFGERATVHYVAKALECTRAEVGRAIELAQQQFRVVFDKQGSVYRIASWGYIAKDQVYAMFRPSLELEHKWRELETDDVSWDREREAKLVDAIVGAVTLRRAPVTRQEADVYRLTAQLLKTRYQTAATFLDGAARYFYGRSKVPPRPFNQVVADRLVSDVPRLRNLLEKRMTGVHSW
jgi:hypothetical protein